MLWVVPLFWKKVLPKWNSLEKTGNGTAACFMGKKWHPCRAGGSPFPLDRFPRWLRGPCAVFHICCPPKRNVTWFLCSEEFQRWHTPWPSNLPGPFLCVPSFLLPFFVEGFSFVCFCFIWPAVCRPLVWMWPLCLVNCTVPSQAEMITKLFYSSLTANCSVILSP